MNFSSILDIYYKDLYPALKELEDDRIKIAKKLKILIAFLIIISLLIIFGIPKIIDIKESDFADMLSTVFTIDVTVYMLYSSFITADYRKDFKKKVIEKLIKSLDENLNYDPNGVFPSSLYKNSLLFLKKYDKYEGDDLVTGKIGKVSIIFSDLHTQYKTKNSKGKTRWHTIFKGLFFMADFNKNFKGITLIFPDTAQKLLGYFGQFFQEIFRKRGLKLVKMDNIEFEKEFVVYSSDQVEARYILTPNLMEKILKIKRLKKTPIYISFVNNHIFIAISSKDNFEPTIFKSLFDIEVFKEYFLTLKLSIGLVEELNLNKRLWSRL